MIKIILKGILFYSTFILCILFVCGIDSIYEQGYLFIGLFVIISLIYLCKTIISEEEIDIISFYKLFNKW